MKDYTSKRTFYKPSPTSPAEPCIIIDFGGGHYFRFAPFYHIVGRDTVAMVEFIDDEWNSAEEIDINYNDLTPAIARQYTQV